MHMCLCEKDKCKRKALFFFESVQVKTQSENEKRFKEEK